MKTKNDHYLPNQLEEAMIEKEQRARIEKEALEKLTEKEIEVLKLRFGFEGGEQLSYYQCGKILNCPTSTVSSTTRRALKKLRIIIVKHKNDIVDSEIGMTLMHLDLLSQSIAHEMYFGVDSQFIENDLADEKVKKMVEQWCRTFILQRLSSSERKKLLDYFLFASRVKGETKEQQSDTKEELVAKFLYELKKEQSFCEKGKIKIRSRNRCFL